MSTPIKLIEMQLQSGPMAYPPIVEKGYGIALLQCADDSTTIQFDSPSAPSIPIVELNSILMSQPFSQLYITNYNQQNGTGNNLLSFLIIKDPSLQITTMAPYIALSNALEMARLLMLMGSGSTSRYYLWNIDGSTTSEQTYIDQNQQYFPEPLIQSFQVLSQPAGISYSLATSALINPSDIVPTLQQPIPSTYIPVGSIVKLMGYSLTYIPSIPTTGTVTILINIQQSLSLAQTSQILTGEA
ncbi:MAG: hypothetical protein QXV17_03515 [Candidatus Micrarchaeaceae archaeon]